MMRIGFELRVWVKYHERQSIPQTQHIPLDFLPSIHPSVATLF